MYKLPPMIECLDPGGSWESHGPHCAHPTATIPILAGSEELAVGTTNGAAVD